MYHCAGSGKAQVFRASANTFPLPSATDIDALERFLKKAMFGNAKNISEVASRLDTDTKGHITSIISKLSLLDGQPPEPEEQIKTSETLGAASLDGQFANALKDSISTITGLNPDNDLLRNSKYTTLTPTLDPTPVPTPAPAPAPSPVPTPLLKEFAKQVYSDPRGNTIALLDTVFGGEDPKEKFPHLDLPAEYGSLKRRQSCLESAREFVEWMADWKRWDDRKFITYLDYPGKEKLKVEILNRKKSYDTVYKDKYDLFFERLNIDFRTMNKYLAGFNKGDLIKSILTSLFCPDRSRYPDSVRNY